MRCRWWRIRISRWRSRCPQCTHVLHQQPMLAFSRPLRAIFARSIPQRPAAFLPLQLFYVLQQFAFNLETRCRYAAGAVLALVLVTSFLLLPEDSKGFIYFQF